MVGKRNNSLVALFTPSRFGPVTPCHGAFFLVQRLAKVFKRLGNILKIRDARVDAFDGD